MFVEGGVLRFFSSATRAVVSDPYGTLAPVQLSEDYMTPPLVIKIDVLTNGVDCSEMY